MRQIKHPMTVPAVLSNRLEMSGNNRENEVNRQKKNHESGKQIIHVHTFCLTCFSEQIAVMVEGANEKLDAILINRCIQINRNRLKHTVLQRACNEEHQINPHPRPSTPPAPPTIHLITFIVFPFVKQAFTGEGGKVLALVAWELVQSGGINEK